MPTIPNRQMILWTVLEPRRERPLRKPKQIKGAQKERRRRAQSNRTTKAEPRLRGRKRKLSSQIPWSKSKVKISRQFAPVPLTR